MTPPTRARSNYTCNIRIFTCQIVKKNNPVQSIKVQHKFANNAHIFLIRSNRNYTAALHVSNACTVLARVLPCACKCEHLFTRRHRKHHLPCTDQQPAESLASTRSAFARRAFRSTGRCVSVRGVVGAEHNGRDVTMRLLRSVGLHPAASDWLCSYFVDLVGLFLL